VYSGGNATVAQMQHILASRPYVLVPSVQKFTAITYRLLLSTILEQLNEQEGACNEVIFWKCYPPYHRRLSRMTQYRVTWEIKISFEPRLDFAGNTQAIPINNPHLPIAKPTF
jgi:hypothetical protein